MSRQANALQDDSIWSMWFGPLQDPNISSRIHSVLSYLNQKQDKNLVEFIFKP